MSSVASTAITICACCIICAVVSFLAPNGTTQKMFNLILGVFFICVILVPIKNAVSNINFNISGYEEIGKINDTSDEELNKQVLKQTADNLVFTLFELFKSEELNPKNIEVYVNTNSSGGIIVSEVNIYIEKQYEKHSEKYIEITEKNLNITPKIILEK